MNLPARQNACLVKQILVNGYAAVIIEVRARNRSSMDLGFQHGPFNFNSSTIQEIHRLDYGQSVIYRTPCFPFGITTPTNRRFKRLSVSANASMGSLIQSDIFRIFSGDFSINSSK